MSEILRISFSLIPVLGFLAALVALDSYKLVSVRTTIRNILIGIAVAVVCLFINALLIHVTGLSLAHYSRYLAPAIEELCKALFLVFLIRESRLSFMVDTAIHGFAVGAGFALAENVYYLVNIQTDNLIVWVIRGFGTAAIHPTTTVVFALISKSLTDRHGAGKFRFYLPGLGAAFALHSLFNHFVFSPVITTIFLLLILPAFTIAVFNRSEKGTQRWLGLGFDADQEVIDILDSGRITESRVGRYLESLRRRFPGYVVADLFCLLRLHTELALRAKGILMLRQAGIPIEKDPEIRAKVDEVKYLEHSIGKTGLLAIRPFLRVTGREMAQLREVL